MLNLSVPQTDRSALIERATLIERAALSLELFATTFGLDWDGADALAIEQLPDLLAYAASWDCAALAAGNATAACPF